jgi:spermidine synthase
VHGAAGEGRVGVRFEELDWRKTPMGEISLRRRWDPVAAREVYEIKLNDEYLMSSLFTTAETEIARLALDALPAGSLAVAVGGLGLGYTAHAVLDHPGVDSLVVVEALAEVIEWHERGLIPGGPRLAGDPRCQLVRGDFFGMLGSTGGLDPTNPDRRFHALIVDIDHSPRHLLHPDHGWFYQPAGLRAAAQWLHPGGVFALWSNDPPDDAFTTALAEVFTDVAAETIRFPNPYQDRPASNTVYRARTPADGAAARGQSR